MEEVCDGICHEVIKVIAKVLSRQPIFGRVYEAETFLIRSKNEAESLPLNPVAR
jgi:hypothetical protein